MSCSPILRLTLALLFLLAPNLVHAAPASRGGISVTDFRGRQITLKQPARRIVCLIESALSGLYMLKAGPQVVGVGTNVYDGQVFPYYAALDDRIRRKALPTPGNWDFVNLESVVALRPDLVIIWSRQQEAIAALEARGIPVYGVFITGIDDVYREMIDLGKLTGTERRARELVAWTRAGFDRFGRRTAAIPAGRQPGVYFMWAQGDLETSCRGSAVGDLIALAGGRNVCVYPDEHRVVNREQILGWNPDLIVMWHNGRRNPADVAGDPRWRSVRAVRDGRVHELPEVFLCDLWTLKALYAVKLLATWTHPELFQDIDLAQERRAMLKTLYGQTFETAKP